MSAADFPLTYTVEEKPLKAAVAGTPLTFSLHRDAGCADAPVYTAVWNIEDVTFITRLKMFTPKGDTKTPGTAEIHHRLLNIAATGQLYLKVTGAGITPVGGACQPQSAQARTLVPTVSGIILAYGTVSGEKWEIENAVALSLPAPIALVPVDETAAAGMLSLSMSARYSCALRLAPYPVSDPQGVNNLFVFGVDSCMLCTHPSPGCL